MYRILMDPAVSGEVGGGGNPAPGAAVAPGATTPPEPAPAPKAAETPSTATIPLAELEALRARAARAAELEAAEAAAKAKAAEAEEARLVEKGKYDEAIALRDRRLREEIDAREAKLRQLSERNRTAALDRALQDAIGKLDLIPGKADKLLRLVRDDFQVEEDAEGNHVVRTARGLESPADYLARVVPTEYDNFLRPRGQGGQGGHRGGATVPPTPAPGADGQMTPGAQAFAYFQQQQQNLARMGLGPRGIKGQYS